MLGILIRIPKHRTARMMIIYRSMTYEYTISLTQPQSHLNHQRQRQMRRRQRQELTTTSIKDANANNHNISSFLSSFLILSNYYSSLLLSSLWLSSPCVSSLSSPSWIPSKDMRMSTMPAQHKSRNYFVTVTFIPRTTTILSSKQQYHYYDNHQQEFKKGRFQYQSISYYHSLQTRHQQNIMTLSSSFDEITENLNQQNDTISHQQQRMTTSMIPSTSSSDEEVSFATKRKRTKKKEEKTKTNTINDDDDDDTVLIVDEMDDVEDDADDTASNQSLETNPYSSNYHVPVMWKECISSLLNCRRGIIRQQQQQNQQQISNEQYDIESAEIPLQDDDNVQENVEGGESTMKHNNKRKKENRKKKLLLSNDIISSSVIPLLPLLPIHDENDHVITANNNDNEYNIPKTSFSYKKDDNNDKTTLLISNVIFVDGTLGGGGHSNALLETLQYGDIVFGCDVDSDALYTACQRLQHYIPSYNNEKVIMSWMNTDKKHNNNDNNNQKEEDMIINDNSSIDTTIDTKKKKTTGRLLLPTFIPVQSNFADITIDKLIKASYEFGGQQLQQHVESILSSKQQNQDQQQSSSSSSNHRNNDVSLNHPGIDGILLDLGVSSYQIDTAERGFAYRFDGPLDMRMSSSSDQNKVVSTSSSTLNAADLCNELDVNELINIFQTYGDEDYYRSKRIAESIVNNHRPIKTTIDLYNAIADVIPEYSNKKQSKRYNRNATLSRIFQSLRIVVNQEDHILQRTMENTTPLLLRSGGRLVVLSYHSMEDRMIKQMIRDGCIYGTNNKTSNRRPPTYRKQYDIYGNPIMNDSNNMLPYRPIGKKLKASNDEMESNRRSRSATLRIGEKQ